MFSSPHTSIPLKRYVPIESVVSYLIVKACPKIVGDDEEMISPFRLVPIWPVQRDQLDCTSHHPWRFEGQWKPIPCKVTSGVYRGVKPISFLRIECSNWAG